MDAELSVGGASCQTGKRSGNFAFGSIGRDPVSQSLCCRQHQSSAFFLSYGRDPLSGGALTTCSVVRFSGALGFSSARSHRHCRKLLCRAGLFRALHGLAFRLGLAPLADHQHSGLMGRFSVLLRGLSVLCARFPVLSAGHCARLAHLLARALPVLVGRADFRFALRCSVLKTSVSISVDRSGLCALRHQRVQPAEALGEGLDALRPLAADAACDAGSYQSSVFLRQCHQCD